MPRTEEERREIRRQATKRWREANKERYRASENTARARKYSSWYERNRAAKLSHSANRVTRLRGAFVEAVDLRELFERDNGICGICSSPVEFTEVTMDHIIPLAKGGLHSYSNTQVAHGSCNFKKGDRI